MPDPSLLSSSWGKILWNVLPICPQKWENEGTRENPLDLEKRIEHMKNINQREAIEAIANREDFIASALMGHDGRSNTYGQLNAEEIQQYEAVKDSIDYVVMSYRTPIAWHSVAGWYVVSQKFSVTTSKHQNYIRRAVSSLKVVA